MSTPPTNPLRAALVGILSSRQLVCESCDKPATHGHNQGGRYCWECGSQGGSEDAELYELQEKPLVEAAMHALAAAEPVVTFTRNIDGAEFVYIGDAAPERRMYIGYSGDAVAKVAEALGARVVRRG